MFSVKSLPTKTVFRLMQMATVCVFLGRAYQHLFWDGPYRELFWDPDYTAWAVKLFTSMTWAEYVTHPDGDVWFQWFVFGLGLFYTVCGLVAVFIEKLPRWTRWFLVAGSTCLVFLALVYMKDRFYHWGQFFEYTLQFSAPLFLFWWLKIKELTGRMLFFMKCAIALTFACHGLYAVGYYPRPEIFMTMTQRLLGVGEVGCLHFLNTVGYVDFIVAVGVFFPKGKWARAVLWYAFFWGALTTLARTAGNFYFDFPWESLHGAAYQSVYRVPHFLFPLLLLVGAWAGNNAQNDPMTTMTNDQMTS